MASAHSQSSLAVQTVSTLRILHTGGGLREHFPLSNSQVASAPHLVASVRAAHPVSLEHTAFVASYPQVASAAQSAPLPLYVGHKSPAITFGPHKLELAVHSHEYVVLAGQSA